MLLNVGWIEMFLVGIADVLQVLLHRIKMLILCLVLLLLYGLGVDWENTLVKIAFRFKMFIFLQTIAICVVHLACLSINVLVVVGIDFEHTQAHNCIIVLVHFVLNLLFGLLRLSQGRLKGLLVSLRSLLIVVEIGPRVFILVLNCWVGLLVS